jgi:hypothetical protein
MSAFIVNPNHLATIVGFIVHNPAHSNIFYNWLNQAKNLSYRNQLNEIDQQFLEEIKKFRDEATESQQFDLLAKVLINTNFESVNFRYESSSKDELDLKKKIAFQEVKKREYSADIMIDVMQFVMACDCLNYQSCERDDYDKSLSHLFLSQAPLAAVRNSSEYKNCKWEIPN